MNRDNHFGQLPLVAWLGFSSLLAATAAAGAIYLAPLALSPVGRLLAGILLGTAAGLLASLPLRSAAGVAAAALAQLSRGQAIAWLPDDWQRRWGPLGELLGWVEVLGGRERELLQLREDLVRSTGQAAAQAERNRLARDLHDSIKQQLYAINVSAAAALARWESDLAGARAAVEDVRRAAQAALSEMAALLQQLRPAPLAAAGLLDALREQAEALAYRTGAAVAVDLGRPDDAAAYTAAVDAGRLAPGAEEAIFRIAQEALNNIARHARAGHVALQLRVAAEALRLEITDDGQGFVLPGPSTDQPLAGYGLAGMRDRAAGIGAALEVTSATGSGTRVALSVPLGLPAAHKEAELSAEMKPWLQKVSVWQSVALAAVFLAMVVAQGLAPRLADASYPPAALALSGILLLACVIGGRIAWTRARAATVAVMLACGADSPFVWRMRRDTAGARVWVALAAIVILPGALMPKAWPQYPVAALAVGAACAVFAAVTLAQSYRATEGYWQRLSVSALAAELDQGWRQRYSWAVVLLISAAGYFGVYGGFQAPWRWPPARDLVLDILVTLFINLVLVMSAISYLQLRSWRERHAGASRQTA